MKSRSIRSAETELAVRLTEPAFLGTIGVTEETMRKILSASGLPGRFPALWPISRRLLCREIFDFCAPLIAAVCPEEPEQGWMKYTYAYACRILFPDETYAAEDARFGAGARIYLETMRFFFDEERKVIPPAKFYDFVYLSREEQEKFDTCAEYRRYLRAFRAEYVYEMMRLNAETTPFRTLEHIAGVHYVAMHVAKGLYDAGVPIDLALISGAAAVHDIGKFGCRPNERVPYLHYYYTSQWCKAHDLPAIGHIAANHSTWDLEPQNLSVESLVLIYSDFRVKSSRGEDNREITFISSLKDAFDVILHKLDNVDQKKLRRYRFVYARLSDFEEYMRYLGVDTDLDGKTERPPRMPEPTLRDADESVRSLVFMGVSHNIQVMHRMSAGRQFGNFLEAARGEKNWKNLRAYLSIFEQYAAYTSDSQKKQILDFLCELFLHREDSIRHEAGRLAGRIIAQYNFGYRKQRPADMPDTDAREAYAIWRRMIGRILHPDEKLTDRQKLRIAYNLKYVMAETLKDAEAGDTPIYLSIFLESFAAPEAVGGSTAAVLLDAAHELPLGLLSREQLNLVADFAVAKLDDPLPEVRIAAWRAAKILTAYAPDLEAAPEIVRKVRGADTGLDLTMTFLRCRILSNLGEDVGPEKKRIYETDVTPEILLEDLKTATPWINICVNIKLLKDQVKHGHFGHRMHIAAHFANLIKSSEFMAVRDGAGDALLEIMPLLRPDERNEVVVELVRGIESGEYEFSKYIPRYLGEASLWLPADQLDGIVGYFSDLLANPNARAAAGALDTVGALLGSYASYRERFPDEPEEEYRGREWKLLGTVIRGLSSHRESVREEALQVLTGVFAGGSMPLDFRYGIFQQGFRKILFYLSNEESGIALYYRASALAAISAFITRWKIDRGGFEKQRPQKIAFFPGTFDPFTLSQKEIARRIRDLGYDVFLAVDEFSWSKKTEPPLIRRKIISMSVAGEFGVNLFPAKIPVNLANPADLRRLRKVFAGREVYIVAGSDVVAGASAYRTDRAPEEDSIYAMPHIIFRRSGDAGGASKAGPVLAAHLKRFRRPPVMLELPEKFEEISASLVRENIDMNRDISPLVEPAVQEYIYDSGLYLREPENKPVASLGSFAITREDHPSDGLTAEVARSCFPGETSGAAVSAEIRLSRDSLLVLRETGGRRRLFGALRYRYVTSDEFYPVFGDAGAADRLRNAASGRILLIRGLYLGNRGEEAPDISDPEQLLLTEVLAGACAAGVSFALYYGGMCPVPEPVRSVLERQGFVRREDILGGAEIYMVDIRLPLMLLLNMETTVKEPLSGNPNVIRAIRNARYRLQMAMTRLYPGQLVLAIPAASIYPGLVRKVMELNGVTSDTDGNGLDMCVPFGKILRSQVIPHTVTKTLHTDKVYEPDLRKSSIEAFSNYPPLEDQIRMIASFNRPVILLDDLLYRGGRLEALLPKFAREHVKIRRVILGILSGYGRDVMAGEGVDVDSVYYLPNLRHWFVESTLYPFIGGDTVRRGDFKVAGLSPSINLIEPYAKPDLPGAAGEDVADFSACCIRSARDMFLALEDEYRKRFGKNLTLERLPEAVIWPLCPDRGACVNVDPGCTASVCLENDLEMLARMRGMA